MMKNKIKVAMIGLDISHAVEYTKLMQDPAIPADRRVGGMVVEKCLRSRLRSKTRLDWTDVSRHSNNSELR